MRGFFLAFVITVAALTGSSAFATDQRNVTVVNGTGYPIKFLGFNNPGDEDWSDNELGGVLPTAATFMSSSTPPTKAASGISRSNGRTPAIRACCGRTSTCAALTPLR
jgi:hypothetical protein